jgi:hypothetical protein
MLQDTTLCRSRRELLQNAAEAAWYVGSNEPGSGHEAFL